VVVAGCYLRGQGLATAKVAEEARGGLKAEEETRRTAEEALLKVTNEAKVAEEDRLKAEERTRTAESLSSARIEHDIHSLRKEQHEGRELPGNKVFVVGPWVNEEIVGHNSKYLPNDFEVHIFNHSSMTRSVRLIDQELREKAGLRGAWESYKLLRPWSYRADLWRYMILWSEGGIYLDSKMKMMAPLTSWAALGKNETVSVCHDGNLKWKSAQRNNANVPSLCTGALSAGRGSPILLQAIKLIIQNVASRSYVIKGERKNIIRTGHADLSITGPILLGYAATSEHIAKGSLRVDCGFYGRKKGAHLNPSNLSSGEMGLIMSVDDTEHKKVRSSGNKYGDLYDHHSIYCDEQGQNEPCDINKLLGV
jgi:hypothetical protein